jgi:hypothetical protein
MINSETPGRLCRPGFFMVLRPLFARVLRSARRDLDHVPHTNVDPRRLHRQFHLRIPRKAQSAMLVCLHAVPHSGGATAIPSSGPARRTQLMHPFMNTHQGTEMK